MGDITQTIERERHATIKIHTQITVTELKMTKIVKVRSPPRLGRNNTKKKKKNYAVGVRIPTTTVRTANVRKMGGIAQTVRRVTSAEIRLLTKATEKIRR